MAMRFFIETCQQNILNTKYMPATHTNKHTIHTFGTLHTARHFQTRRATTNALQQIVKQFEPVLVDVAQRAVAFLDGAKHNVRRNHFDRLFARRQKELFERRRAVDVVEEGVGAIDQRRFTDDELAKDARHGDVLLLQEVLHHFVENVEPHLVVEQRAVLGLGVALFAQTLRNNVLQRRHLHNTTSAHPTHTRFVHTHLLRKQRFILPVWYLDKIHSAIRFQQLFLSIHKTILFTTHHM